MHLPRRYKKGVASSAAVAGSVLHEFSAPALDEVQLVLRVGLLRVLAPGRIQLGAHAAMAQEFHEPLSGRAGQLLQTLIHGVFHRASCVVVWLSPR
ncbi:hypothetical protein ASF16_16945 [Acidovorax sp. Leaf78]|nr:hypothetical protein ASF16_16945 [Acidovorax sp. Leaf78]